MIKAGILNRGFRCGECNDLTYKGISIAMHKRNIKFCFNCYHRLLEELYDVNDILKRAEIQYATDHLIT